MNPKKIEVNTYTHSNYNANVDATNRKNSRVYVNGYNNANSNTVVREEGGYTVDHTCSVNFMVDSKASKITAVDWKGNDCYNTFLKSSYVAPSWLASMSNKIVEIPVGTAVPIVFSETIDANRLKENLVVSIAIANDVKIKNQTVIKAGTKGQAKILSFSKASFLGTPANLTIDNFSTASTDEYSLPLRGQMAKVGTDRTVLSILTGSLLILPLFIKGGTVLIPAGKEETVYTAVDAYVKL
jgi:hypothetical protein